MKRLITAFFAILFVSVSLAAELKDTIKVEVAREISAGAPLLIKLSNIPKGYNFHGYLFHASYGNVPEGLANGAEVYIRKYKNPKWNVFIFGPALADRMTYIKARDMWRRNFDLTFKTERWPLGKYRTGINLSFLDSNRKPIMIKKELVFSIVQKADAAK